MTSKFNVRRDGKGRDIPGPSPSRQGLTVAIAVTVLVLTLATQFAVGIEARRTLSAEALAASAAVFGAFGMLVVSGSVRGRKMGDPRTMIVSLVLGAIGLFGAPYAVFLHRYSDAPPGSEILFLTTAAWSAILVLLTLRKRPSEVIAVAAALLILCGIAGVVGNWERPSSFSPFIRYAAEERWMLLAGVAWALLWQQLGRARDRRDIDGVAIPAAVGGVLAAALTLLARLGEANITLAFSYGGFWLYSVAALASGAAMLLALRTGGVRVVAGAVALPAVALTVLTIIEQATGAFGPQPILLVPAFCGALVALAGATLLWLPDDSVTPAARRPVCRLAVPVAVASLLAALVGLALPALQGRATGLMTSGADFDATFTLLGVEVVGPWIAVGVAATVLGIACARVPTWQRALALGVTLVAWPFVWATPLRTLTRFLPSEVQVDFGSEFAAIAFSRLPVPATLVALGGAVGALALLLVCRTRSRTSEVPESPTER
jgi:hypothetical protein